MVGCCPNRSKLQLWQAHKACSSSSSSSGGGGGGGGGSGGGGGVAAGGMFSIATESPTSSSSRSLILSRGIDALAFRPFRPSFTFPQPACLLAFHCAAVADISAIGRRRLIAYAY
jgi:hypothetical protein